MRIAWTLLLYLKGETMSAVPVNLDRTREIWEAHTSGESYSSIGQRMGLSRVRVGQLSKQYENYISKKPFYDVVLSVVDIDLATASRMYNALCRSFGNGVSLYDALAISDDDCIKLRNVGVKTLSIVSKLREHRDDPQYHMKKIILSI